MKLRRNEGVHLVHLLLGNAVEQVVLALPHLEHGLLAYGLERLDDIDRLLNWNLVVNPASSNRISDVISSTDSRAGGSRSVNNERRWGCKLA